MDEIYEMKRERERIAGLTTQQLSIIGSYKKTEKKRKSYFCAFFLLQTQKKLILLRGKIIKTHKSLSIHILFMFSI